MASSNCAAPCPWRPAASTRGPAPAGAPAEACFDATAFSSTVARLIAARPPRCPPRPGRPTASGTIAAVDLGLLQLRADALPVRLPHVGRRAHQRHPAPLAARELVERLLHPIPIQQRPAQALAGGLALGLQLQGGLEGLLGLRQVPRRAARLAQRELEVEGRAAPSSRPRAAAAPRCTCPAPPAAAPAPAAAAPAASPTAYVSVERLSPLPSASLSSWPERQPALRQADARHRVIRGDLPRRRIEAQRVLGSSAPWPGQRRGRGPRQTVRRPAFSASTTPSEYRTSGPPGQTTAWPWR